jgi:hypothetical protein
MRACHKQNRTFFQVGGPTTDTTPEKSRRLPSDAAVAAERRRACTGVVAGERGTARTGPLRERVVADFASTRKGGVAGEKEGLHDDAMMIMMS